MKIRIAFVVVAALLSGACTFYAKVGKGPRVIGEPQAPATEVKQ